MRAIVGVLMGICLILICERCAQAQTLSANLTANCDSVCIQGLTPPLTIQLYQCFGYVPITTTKKDGTLVVTGWTPCKPMSPVATIQLGGVYTPTGPNSYGCYAVNYVDVNGNQSPMSNTVCVTLYGTGNY